MIRETKITSNLTWGLAANSTITHDTMPENTEANIRRVFLSMYSAYAAVSELTAQKTAFSQTLTFYNLQT